MAARPKSTTAISKHLDAIRSALAELERLSPDTPALWKVGQPASEASVKAVEAALGFGLPAGYRAYVLAIGDGGAGLHTSLHGGMTRLAALLDDKQALAVARREFPLSASWYSPDDVAQLKEAGLYQRVAKYCVPLPAGTEATDGTMSLGCPTGTGEEYHLVLRGPHAGEIWLDATSEDCGGVTPLKPAEFVAASVQFFSAQVTTCREAVSVTTALTSGDVLPLLRGKPAEVQRVRQQLQSAAFKLLRVPTTPPAHLAGVARALLALNQNNLPEAGAIFLRAGSFEDALLVAERGLREGADPAHLQHRFLPAHGLHSQIACAGLGRAPPSGLPRPTATSLAPSAPSR